MGPERVNRSIADRTAAEVADEAALQAARDAYAGIWDIVEVFGGYLAVPDGTPFVQSTTLGGLSGKLDRAPDPREHDGEPLPGTVYSIGPQNAQRLADLRNASHYPVEAVCRCGVRITCERLVGGEWVHEPR